MIKIKMMVTIVRGVKVPDYFVFVVDPAVALFKRLCYKPII